jgi:hypothetical protein
MTSKHQPLKVLPCHQLLAQLLLPTTSHLLINVADVNRPPHIVLQTALHLLPPLLLWRLRLAGVCLHAIATPATPVAAVAAAAPGPMAIWTWPTHVTSEPWWMPIHAHVVVLVTRAPCCRTHAG